MDEIVLHLLRVDGDEDGGAELLVEILNHLDEKRVEDTGGALQLRRTLPVSSPLG